MIFKVRVLCVGTVGAGRKKLQRRYLTALVDAPDLDGAMKAGTDYAENIVPSSLLWREFTTLEASRQFLPYTLELK